MESPTGWTEDLVSDVCDETSVEIAFREEAEALRTASLRLDRDTGEAYEVPPTMTFTGAQADHIVTIPQYGAVASLNVAVSASIVMYELMKGQKTNAISGDEFI